MKKILITAATTLLSVIPAAAAHADTTGISATQDQNYSNSSSSNEGDNSSVEQYSNKTVSYEALYYVNYSASETNYLKAMTSSWDNQDSSADASNNYTTNFSNMMGSGNWGGNMGGQMGGSMGGSMGHEN